jgi:hypothetical protein
MENYVDEMMHKLFEIKCKKCGSENVTLSFYPGFVYDGGGSTGNISVECNNCLSKVEDY